jgi:2-succinyl-5-enolpyruvyl-6-hydroxy-3-cyclohexene-1-carboxylate synthase
MFIPIPRAKLQQNAYEVNHKCKMQNTLSSGQTVTCVANSSVVRQLSMNFKKSAKSECPSSLGATGVGEDG